MRNTCLVILVVAACSDGASVTADARAIDAYDTARCLIKGNYGDLGAITGTAAMNGTSPTLTFVLDPGPPGKDDLFFKLMSGRCGFTGGLAPGTCSITGVDTVFTTFVVWGNVIVAIIPMPVA